MKRRRWTKRWPDGRPIWVMRSQACRAVRRMRAELRGLERRETAMRNELLKSWSTQIRRVADELGRIAGGIEYVAGVIERGEAADAGGKTDPPADRRARKAGAPGRAQARPKRVRKPAPAKARKVRRRSRVAGRMTP